MHTKFKILMLVRHGQSTGNVDQPTHDHASIPLTALGEEQAKKLSARIDAVSYTHLSLAFAALLQGLTVRSSEDLIQQMGWGLLFVPYIIKYLCSL